MTEKKYIEVNAFLEKVERRRPNFAPLPFQEGYGDIIRQLEDEPSIDVEEVKSANWTGEIEKVTYNCARCSNCGWLAPCITYCGICGARMK